MTSPLTDGDEFSREEDSVPAAEGQEAAFLPVHKGPHDIASGDEEAELVIIKQPSARVLPGDLLVRWCGDGGREGRK